MIFNSRHVYSNTTANSGLGFNINCFTHSFTSVCSSIQVTNFTILIPVVHYSVFINHILISHISTLLSFKYVQFKHSSWTYFIGVFLPGWFCWDHATIYTLYTEKTSILKHDLVLVISSRLSLRCAPVSWPNKQTMCLEILLWTNKHRTHQFQQIKWHPHSSRKTLNWKMWRIRI
jgi:hypothetical protein